MDNAQESRKKGRSENAARVPAAGGVCPSKSIDQLMKEQGITPGTQLQKLLGAGKDLWQSDEEFEAFLNGIYARRREGLAREQAKRGPRRKGRAS